jgi:Fuc2NAc and GlcNAc transferase
MFHVAAVAWAIWWLGGIGPLNVGVGIWEWGYLGYFVVTIGLVWLINLTNFMDGIDAMASTEIAFAGAFAGGLLMLGGSAGLGWACWVLAASTLGCLRWNWPPAKIFLGDVGSGFLGFVYGVLMLAAINKGVSSFWPWLILFGVFVVDATVTLTRRVVAGMRWYEAHRSHAYQHAASRWGHLRVTVAVCVINVVWLAPMTFVAWMWPGTAPLVFIFSLSPLVALAVHLNAGKAAGSAM